MVPRKQKKVENRRGKMLAFQSDSYLRCKNLSNTCIDRFCLTALYKKYISLDSCFQIELHTKVAVLPGQKEAAEFYC